MFIVPNKILFWIIFLFSFLFHTQKLMGFWNSFPFNGSYVNNETICVQQNFNRESDHRVSISLDAFIVLTFSFSFSFPYFHIYSRLAFLIQRIRNDSSRFCSYCFRIGRNGFSFFFSLKPAKIFQKAFNEFLVEFLWH